jgi:phage-related protein
LEAWVPHTEVYFYREADGRSTVLDWLTDLRGTDAKAFVQCLAKLRLLKMLGFELRRPAADYLRDGIYELRAKHGTVQYRMLYFFHGRNIAIVAHGLTKRKEVPAVDIDRATERRRRYEQNPIRHRCPEEIENLEAPP